MGDVSGVTKVAVADKDVVGRVGRRVGAKANAKVKCTKNRPQTQIIIAVASLLKVGGDATCRNNENVKQSRYPGGDSQVWMT